MPRKSSVHFKPVSNVRFAVSHSERTDLSEPAYLLPKEHQLDNVIVTGSLSENELAALFIKQKEAMTGQAKARGSSPFWEGVVVLGNTDAKEQSANLLDWKKAYEQTTGHKVLHMSVHLDEGYIGKDGKPVYNPHAHVIVSRMNAQNRVIKLERKELAAVQDLTAQTLKMERGSTLAERGGRRGRAHIGHREYRAQADEARLNLDVEKSKTAFEIGSSDRKIALLRDAKKEAAKVPALESQISTQATDIATLRKRLADAYRLQRKTMKESGNASQPDYQNLKKAYEDAMAALEVGNGQLAELTARNAQLDAKGVPAHLITPTPAPMPSPPKQVREAVAPAPARTAVEAPKPQALPTPSPAPEKSPLERLEASLRVFLEWIKGKGGQHVTVDTQQSAHFGPIVQLDDLHALQSTGRGKYAVHELAQLDRVPALDDNKTEIRYRGGVGWVKGAGLGKGGLGD